MVLAKRQEQFWHDQGFPAAHFWAEPIGERFEKVGTYEIYRVMSNLVNGLPPRYLDHGDVRGAYCLKASCRTGTAGCLY
jgi:hypothetical protein